MAEYREDIPERPAKREAVFQPEFIDDLRYWVEKDRKTALRLLDLVEAILRDPFTGTGKPEPLRHLAAGMWFRRLTQEHRIVYVVQEDRVHFLQGRYHYELNPLRCAGAGAKRPGPVSLAAVGEHSLSDGPR